MHLEKCQLYIFYILKSNAINKLPLWDREIEFQATKEAYQRIGEIAEDYFVKKIFGPFGYMWQELLKIYCNVCHENFRFPNMI